MDVFWEQLSPKFKTA